MGVLAISISAMLGSGIFVLPGLAAGMTGPSVWLAYIVAGVCVLPAALSKAELSTAMPTSGGSYVYIERTFGPLAGTVSGLGLWLSLLLKSAFALVGFGAYSAQARRKRTAHWGYGPQRVGYKGDWSSSESRIGLSHYWFVYLGLHGYFSL